ncbi:MAG: hypothetical protein NVSMB29_17700 [Candidatus Dormibacteria bacterium]
MRGRSRGQAAVEFALLAPLLILLAVGTFDMGTTVADTAVVAGQVRAGLRTVQNNVTTDVGASVRGEDTPSIVNNVANWGATGTGNTNDCDPTQVTHNCGDPQGCVATSTHWTTPGGAGAPNPIACFAVTYCYYSGTPPAGEVSCPVPATRSWGTRPVASTTNVSIVLRVVIKFTPATPMMRQFTAGGTISVTRDGYALPLY